MENFKDLVQKRRSIRKFTDEEIKAEDLQMILRAALWWWMTRVCSRRFRCADRWAVSSSQVRKWLSLC